ncbi:PREDICTED: uncharacterized protein LOC109116035 isoform X1 [Tarenaya hassleriana]|uniref:uncharacterized protein LOC109116035 isoform X1 n=1 Tax=Tarenaya hassleriana TaxID=28532 RepID=UPI0008FD5203|nr:PREDICTED: uncharacterized protein LOC109116035 isoform X1 [Tarenaya hassleriana]
MVVPMVEEIHTMTIDHDKKNGSDDESLDEEMSPMDVMMNDLTTEDKSPEKEASHTSTIILHPSIQRHPSISFIKWQNNRVCNLFFFPIPLKICFSNDMLGFVSVFGQKQHKIILKICGVEKFTSEGEWHDTLVSFSTEEDISDHNLMALPTSFNNSWFGKNILNPYILYLRKHIHELHIEKQNIIVLNTLDHVKDINNLFLEFNKHLSDIFSINIKPYINFTRQMAFHVSKSLNLAFIHIRILFLLLFDESHIVARLYSVLRIKRSATASLAISNNFIEFIQKMKQKRTYAMVDKLKEPAWETITHLMGTGSNMKTSSTRSAFRHSSKPILRGNVEYNDHTRRNLMNALMCTYMTLHVLHANHK